MKKELRAFATGRGTHNCQNGKGEVPSLERNFE